MRPTEPDNSQVRVLRTRAQQGDEGALRDLVEPYRRGLQVHCYLMLGSPHDADAIVKETLLRAWRELGRFEPRASLTTWLYRIATNACLDEIERRDASFERADPLPEYDAFTDSKHQPLLSSQANRQAPLDRTS
jgi:RNA polymerase sigma-70 factor, ECF subfamily